MRFVVITGMSGAGKSQAVNALEDIGYYCVDNIPPKLLVHFFTLKEFEENAFPDKIAIVVDSRGGEMFKDLFEGLDQLERMGYSYQILFLDCKDEAIISRYKLTRRKHPLVSEQTPNMADALEKERALLRPAMHRADYKIDTTFLTAKELKEQVVSVFSSETAEKIMINCLSFGFTYGIPTDADLVFDVRCLPNPFYIEELKHKTGLDQSVRDYVFSFSQANDLYDKILDILRFTIPLYRKEGRRQLVVAFGCTGGKHRSVSFALRAAADLKNDGENVFVNHRDAARQ